MPRRSIRTAIDSFGRLDTLVNNAGILRDRMIVSTTEEEWDAVIRVTLKGHFAPMRHAGAYWREIAKSGEQVDGRIVNTELRGGAHGQHRPGQLRRREGRNRRVDRHRRGRAGRYGVTVNAIAPSARTRLTEARLRRQMAADSEGFDAMAPENVSPLVVWLGSADSKDVTGRVFEVEGGKLSIADGWQHGEAVDKGDRWDPAEVGAAVRELIAKSPAPAPVYGAS